MPPNTSQGRPGIVRGPRESKAKIYIFRKIVAIDGTKNDIWLEAYLG